MKLWLGAATGGEDSGVTIIIIIVVIVINVFAGVGACIGFMRASAEGQWHQGHYGQSPKRPPPRSQRRRRRTRRRWNSTKTSPRSWQRAWASSTRCSRAALPFAGKHRRGRERVLWLRQRIRGQGGRRRHGGAARRGGARAGDAANKNAESLVEGKEIEARMRQLLELLRAFHTAVRAFGERRWFKRMWTIREHVDSLAELDRDIKLQLEMFRDASR